VTEFQLRSNPTKQVFAALASFECKCLPIDYGLFLYKATVIGYAAHARCRYILFTQLNQMNNYSPITDIGLTLNCA